MVDRWLVCRSRSRRMWGEWLFCQMIFRDWAFFCPGLHFRCGRGEMEVIPWGVHRCILGSRTSNPRHPFPPQPSPSIHSAPSPLEENWKWKKIGLTQAQPKLSNNVGTESHSNEIGPISLHIDICRFFVWYYNLSSSIILRTQFMVVSSGITINIILLAIQLFQVLLSRKSLLLEFAGGCLYC